MNTLNKLRLIELTTNMEIFNKHKIEHAINENVHNKSSKMFTCDLAVNDDIKTTFNPSQNEYSHMIKIDEMTFIEIIEGNTSIKLNSNI